MVDADVPDETLPPKEKDSVSTQSADRILESETTTAYSYIYASGKLLQEKVTTDGTTETHNFFYDNTGKPYAMQVDGTTYYYITNLQGDVMGLVDTSGNSVASYTYDPYGKVLTATGALAEKNPLRYRGYYYDSESGLYYLQSRYYDPATRRFVNADTYASTGQGVLGVNMFAYGLNNPVNHIDSSGKSALLIFGVIAAGAIVGGILGAFNAATSGGSTADVVESVVIGAATGAISASAGLLTPLWMISAAPYLAGLVGAGIDIGVQAVRQYIEKGKVEVECFDIPRAVKTGIETGLGTAVPAYGSPCANGVDAVGTMVLWGEASALISCGDVAFTKLKDSWSQKRGGASSRTALRICFQ